MSATATVHSTAPAVKFIDSATDAWHEVTADDALLAVPAEEANRLLSIAQWQDVRASWPAGLPVGLVIPNDVDIETIVDDAARFSVIALHFPKWVDGRAYSQARLLRSRYRFAGEIRATGEVLADMLPLLQRTGFDAVVLRADQSQAVAERALGFFPDGHYQGDTVERRPHFARGAKAAA
jgi:uncharacterized protein (DUF934 family)